MYKLKPNQPAFEIVDGPLAGRKFEHGKAYAKAPGGFRARFKRIKRAPAVMKKEDKKPRSQEEQKKKPE